MRRIASNEKFKININIVILILILIIIQDEIIIVNQINENQEILNYREIDFSLTKIYNPKSNLLTIILAIHLLLTIISVTKMVKHNKGPLRKINYE